RTYENPPFEKNPPSRKKMTITSLPALMLLRGHTQRKPLLRKSIVILRKRLANNFQEKIL
ncbi:hypothetical protein, partial [Thermogutta sp.]|uniref:hypothetical protein n=1 Tax=Thermogutta sp. TaxID=1962930 RepID=UPI0025FCDFB6